MRWIALALLVELIPTPALEVAARVDGTEVSMREVDAPSHAKLEYLHAQLQALVAATVDRLIDDRLQALSADAGAPGPTPVPVTDDAIRAFERSHQEEFQRPLAPPAVADAPDVTRAAIRHWLERQARDAAEAGARRRRRRQHSIEHFLPDARALDRALPPEREVARIDGRPLLAGEVERAAALGLYRLRGEVFRERQRNLADAVDERLLAREANRRKMSKVVLQAELAAPAPVSDAELDAFIEAERAAGRPAPAPDRARPYLEFQKGHARRAALLDQLRRAARIEVLLKEPVVPLLPIEEGGAPVLGPPQGKRLIVYTNYRCAACRAAHGETDRLRQADASVRVVFRDFVPAYDPVATEAACLGRCADRLGAFESMRRELLRREPPPFGARWFSPEALADLARQLGVDPARLAACVAGAQVRSDIERDTAHARALGFEEAPAFVAEGIPLSGMQSADGLARAVRRGTLRQAEDAGRE